MKLVPLLLLVVPSLANASKPPPAKPQTSQNSQADAIEAIKKLGGGVTLDKSGKVISVKFGGTNVTDAGLVYLKQLTSLRELNLNATKVTDAGLVHLKRLSGLKSLALNYTKVTDAGLAHLTGLTSLRELSLNVTKITDAGFVHLKGLTNLRTLNLSGDRINDAGLVHLKGLVRLHSLNLGGTNVTDAGLVYLKRLTGLQSLGLNVTKVTDAGLVHLKDLTKLQSLALGGTKITDAGLVHLKALTKLQDLFIARTLVTAAGVRKLEAALPKCRIAHSPFLRTSKPKPMRTPIREPINLATGQELIARGAMLALRSGVSMFIWRAEMRQHPGSSVWSPGARFWVAPDHVSLGLNAEYRTRNSECRRDGSVAVMLSLLPSEFLVLHSAFPSTWHDDVAQQRRQATRRFHSLHIH